MPSSSALATAAVSTTAALALTNAFVQPGAPRGLEISRPASYGAAAGANAPLREVGGSWATFGVACAGAAIAASSAKAKAAARQPSVVARAAFDPSQQIGAMSPMGFFDPAGFSKPGDEAGFRNLRAAELKHGRVAMMAALGGVIQHYIKFPGFEKVPAGVAALASAPGTYGFAALFLIAGVLELAVWTQDDKKEPGNFGDPVGLGQYDEDMRNKELNNGRIAMFAALGIVAADLVTGKDAMQQFGL